MTMPITYTLTVTEAEANIVLAAIQQAPLPLVHSQPLLQKLIDEIKKQQETEKQDATS